MSQRVNQLLGNGGAAELGIAAEEHIQAGFHGGNPVHTLMFVKTLILNGNRSIDQCLGNFRQGCHLPVCGSIDLLELLNISGTVHIIHKGGLVHAIVINGPVGCLCQNILLQVKRLPRGVLRKTMEEVFTDYFDEFTKKHWDKIKAGLELNDTQVETLQAEIRKLNPKPGASMGETEGRNMQQITPDFIIDTNDDGTITFSLNRGNIPQLTVSPSFTDMIDTYRKHKDKMSRSDKEALLYAKEKVDKAQGFIEAIKQRRHTLIVTMKAIIDIQRQFFLDGDEADLKPMILKDVAERTGLDISTISRVSNVKYAQTKWGTFPLKFFFTDSYTTEDGEEMSTRKIKIALHDIIEKEDKKKPISDDALAKLLKEKGFPIARRTVAKYREQLGIPVARLRK